MHFIILHLFQQMAETLHLNIYRVKTIFINFLKMISVSVLYRNFHHTKQFCS